MVPRSPYVEIWNDLSNTKSMVFMAGPRQVGKTTLAKSIADNFANQVYFNWDVVTDRTALIENPYFFEEVERKDATKPLVVFDEIHRYRDWKNYLKCVYDRFHEDFRFLATGSGRLDLYQKGGDSLAGRYFMFHLWPFTISELSDRRREMDDFKGNPLEITVEDDGELKDRWRDLSELSGFAEPFLSGDKTAYRRWSSNYAQQLIREDIRDLTQIQSIPELETLYHLIPSKVGSPLSIPSLSRNLKVAYNTIRQWLDTFKRFFMVFDISPWHRDIKRAVQKERKCYIWDTPRIKDEAARFENMVAIELHKAATLWNDQGLGRFGLHYIKNKEQQEVDFLLSDDNEPLVLIEAKQSLERPSGPLMKFQDMLAVPAVQLVDRQGGFRQVSNGTNKILIAPAWQWLSSFP